MSFENEHLVITNELMKKFPLCEISTILIENTQTTMTSYLINKVVEKGIKLALCNEKHQIQSEVVSLTNHHSQSGNIHLQINWSETIKAKLWAAIIKEKISMQKQAISYLTGGYSQLIDDYYQNVVDGDMTNREGQAARLHFNTLFGQNFVRHQDDDINAMLNYGYAIIHSHVSRVVVLNGYITNIGIKHVGKTNPFNLSYDFMEPFRPIVDIIVHQQKAKPFDQECRKELIKVLYQKVSYGGMVYVVADAIEIFVRDCLNSLANEAITLKPMKLLEIQ